MARCRSCGNVDTFQHDHRDKTCRQTSCQTCRSLDFLDEEIKIIKARLEFLMDSRDDLQSKFDVLHKSIVDRLPVELSMHVFQLVIEDYRGLKNYRAYWTSRLRLGAVCRNWRRIAWSTPHIWSHLVVLLGPKTNESYIKLAIDWLGRSGQLPLRILVALRRQYVTSWLGPTQEQKFYPLLDSINQSSDRWQELALLYLTPTMLSRLHDVQGASNLRDLQVWSNTSPPGRLSISNAAPHSVELVNIPLDSLRFHWSNLTRLNARGLDVNSILEVLSLAQCLEHFDVVCLGINHSEPIAPARSITHKRLNLFRLESVCSANALSLLFIHLKLPGLFEIDIEAPLGKLSVDIFSLFLEQSACLLKTLRLKQVLLTGDELINIFNKVPTVQHLTLVASTIDPPLAWTPFLCALSGSPTPDNLQVVIPDQPLLPFLEECRIVRCHFFPWYTIPGIFSSIEHAGVSRPRPLKSLVIFARCIVNHEAPVIERHVLYRLSDLYEDGVNLDITAGYLNERKDIFKLSFDKIRKDLEGDRDWSMALPDPSDINYFWDLTK